MASGFVPKFEKIQVASAWAFSKSMPMAKSTETPQNSSVIFGFRRSCALLIFEYTWKKDRCLYADRRRGRTVMKTGLVLEGGAMRGMFTAGVLDVLMEHGITVDGAIGVSAGAVFGCNYKSHQIGRTIRYSTEYCKDKRYASFGNLLRTGNLYSEQFCYHTVPEKLDPFDTEAFRENPMDFFVVCTDVRTGEPIYRKCRTGDVEDIQWMQASASMPLAAKIVKIGHYQLLDGGVADSIPVRFFESIGYKRNLIILTQPKGFVKQKNKMLPLIRARYVRYPAFVEAVADRHQRYNETLAYISMLEQSGRAFVIRPPIPLEIPSMERDPAQLRRVYETGRAVAQIQIDKIAAYVEESKAAPEE